MAPPKGNQYWKLRLTQGRTNKLTPRRLKSEAIKYFEFVVDNPIEVTKAVMYQGEQVDLIEKHPKVMTVSGLCRFVGISEAVFYQYSKQDEYQEIIEGLRGIMFDYKLEGAAAGVFNANIIARELQLGDKVAVEVSEPLDADERRLKIAELLGKC